MVVKFHNKSELPPLVTEDVPVLEQRTGVHQVIEAMTQVNAVEGLRDSIVAQQKRVSKLADAEYLLPFTLTSLTNESRLLKDMYNDVIRFQTSASVLAYLRDTVEHGGLVQGALAYQAEATLRDEVQEATLAAMELLAMKAG